MEKANKLGKGVAKITAELTGNEISIMSSKK